MKRINDEILDSSKLNTIYGYQDDIFLNLSLTIKISTRDQEPKIMSQELCPNQSDFIVPEGTILGISPVQSCFPAYNITIINPLRSTKIEPEELQSIARSFLKKRGFTLTILNKAEFENKRVEHPPNVVCDLSIGVPQEQRESSTESGHEISTTPFGDGNRNTPNAEPARSCLSRIPK